MRSVEDRLVAHPALSRAERHEEDGVRPERRVREFPGLLREARGERTDEDEREGLRPEVGDVRPRGAPALRLDGAEGQLERAVGKRDREDRPDEGREIVQGERVGHGVLREAEGCPATSVPSRVRGRRVRRGGVDSPPARAA